MKLLFPYFAFVICSLQESLRSPSQNVHAYLSAFSYVFDRKEVGSEACKLSPKEKSFGKKIEQSYIRDELSVCW